MSNFIGEQLKQLIENGGAGGSCVITDLGEQGGHLEAESVIIELLKPDSVPNGKYLYSYSNNCSYDSAIAICSKFDGVIYGSQIRSLGDIRKFKYTIETEDLQQKCFQELGRESDIIDIGGYSTHIWNLNPGIYRLTHTGTKKIYSSTTASFTCTIDNPIIYVNSYTDDDGVEYRLWSSITGNSSCVPYIMCGFGRIDGSGGSHYAKSIVSLLTNISSYVKNELTYSTSNTTYALSAYQGYLLDQNKQNKTDETLETTSKEIVGAINELNGKIGSAGSQFYVSSETANIETYGFSSAYLTILDGQREPQVGDFICASLRGSNLLAFCISSITGHYTYTATYAFPIQGNDGTNGTDGKGIVGTLEQLGITSEYNIGDTVVVETGAYYTSTAGNYFILRYGNTAITDYRSLLLKLHVYNYNGSIHTYTCSAVCYLTGEKGASSNVSFTPTLTSGTEIGTLTIDGTQQTLYAPTSSGSTGGSQLYLHSCRLYHYNGPAIDREIYFDIYSTTDTSYTLEELMTWWQEKEVAVHQNIIINAYGAAIIDSEVVQFSRISFGTNSIQAYTPYSLGTSGGLPSLNTTYSSVFQTTDYFVDTVITL